MQETYGIKRVKLFARLNFCVLKAFLMTAARLKLFLLLSACVRPRLAIKLFCNHENAHFSLQ